MKSIAPKGAIEATPPHPIVKLMSPKLWHTSQGEYQDWYCPKIKEKYMKYKKKKAMYARWEESEPNDSDSDEETTKCALHDPNICFMDHEDEVQSNSDDESFYMQCELGTALEELNFEF
ncbi:uncharacterized protein A4U43_C06F9870 [Asparagus officinalis]|uniref:Uncharacterized protein n=1 Tax=Asparagus officinalis TaxID=4686 RepID=A0A5P1ELQ7_ASPOF|nr:uncharacterized protein A4U43_C06F9870 [Asparagus officinalis]